MLSRPTTWRRDAVTIDITASKYIEGCTRLVEMCRITINQLSVDILMLYKRSLTAYRIGKRSPTKTVDPPFQNARFSFLAPQPYK